MGPQFKPPSIFHTSHGPRSTVRGPHAMGRRPARIKANTLIASLQPRPYRPRCNAQPARSPPMPSNGLTLKSEQHCPIPPGQHAGKGSRHCNRAGAQDKHKLERKCAAILPPQPHRQRTCAAIVPPQPHRQVKVKVACQRGLLGRKLNKTSEAPDQMRRDKRPNAYPMGATLYLVAHPSIGHIVGHSLARRDGYRHHIRGPPRSRACDVDAYCACLLETSDVRSFEHL